MDDCQGGGDFFMGNSFLQTHFFGIFSKMTNVSQIFWGGRLTRGKKMVRLTQQIELSFT